MLVRILGTRATKALLVGGNPLMWRPQIGRLTPRQLLWYFSAYPNGPLKFLFPFSLASHLAQNMHSKNSRQWAKPGIRAQLISLKDRPLVMDFLIKRDSESLHILNAVSPGFTCAFPFARYICDQIAMI